MDVLIDQYKFRLIRKIAEGGMGAVYEAIQQGTEGFEKIVAIKTILEKLSADREFIDMFIGEAKLVADLVHQNIVQVYQLGRAGSRFYIAMEYVHGVNLEEFMERHQELGRQIPVELVAFIISRVCLGLDYAHNKTDKDGRLLHVVHRDISPKNILIDTQGVVKITDFGIAKARDTMRSREGEVLMGKVQYMSPEQAAFLETDRRSDVFSLAVIMYEMLAGVNMFADDDTMVSMSNVIHKPIPPVTELRSDTPKELAGILEKALERDLGHRYQSANDFGFDLQYFMYRDGFGPTYQALEAYLKEIFPHFADPKVSRTIGPASYHSFSDTLVLKSESPPTDSTAEAEPATEGHDRPTTT